MTISEGFTEDNISSVDMAYFVSDDVAEGYIIDDLGSTQYFEYGNETFVDSDGNIYNVTHQENSASKAACSHNLINGQYYSHSPNGTSCTVTVYNAQKCTKCTYIKLLDRISQTTYDKCPH